MNSFAELPVQLVAKSLVTSTLPVQLVLFWVPGCPGVMNAFWWLRESINPSSSYKSHERTPSWFKAFCGSRAESCNVLWCIVPLYNKIYLLKLIHSCSFLACGVCLRNSLC